MPLSHTRSAQLFAEAQRVIPGGVNSPVRAFKSVGGDPLFMERAEGPHIFDVDGNQYIDYVMSWGPMLFGHAHPKILAAITKAAARGTSFGASTEAEIRLAEEIVKAVRSIEKVRLVSSGTEAVMSAIRVARGFTKRDKIIKFEGCYHGHSDGLLAKAGSGLATFDMPDSAGVPANLTRDTLTVPFHDIDAVRAAFEAHPGEVACIIVEPVPGNMGVIETKPTFLLGLKELAKEYGSVLIFDEVMTGFRLAQGGAQEYFGLSADMTVLGKIVGGGLPLAAYGGRAEIMDVVAPLGPVYQAGTLSGNPLAVAAGLAQLKLIDSERVATYRKLEGYTCLMAQEIRRSAESAGIPVQVNHVGAMITTFFTDTPVTDYATARTANTVRYAAFFRALLENGVYFPPSQFEAAFVSTVHSDLELYQTGEAIKKAFHGLV